MRKRTSQTTVRDENGLDEYGTSHQPECWDPPSDKPTDHYPAAYRRAYDLDRRPRRLGSYEDWDTAGDADHDDDRDGWNDDDAWGTDWVEDLDAGWDDDAPGGPVWLPHSLTDDLDTPPAPRQLADLAAEQAHLLAIGWDDHDLPPGLAEQVRQVRRAIVQAAKRTGASTGSPAAPAARSRGTEAGR